MVSTCKRCLLNQLSEESFQSIYAYIAALPKEQKAQPTLYQERLSQCKGCDKLQNGMCSLCGCFVEVRAAKILQSCPHTPKRW